MHYKSLLSILGLTAALFAAGCSTANRTVITGAWDNPDYPVKEFNKILVLGISQNQSARAVVEQTVADELAAEGFTTVTATQSFSVSELEEMKGNRDLAHSRLSEIGVDGILIMSVLDVKEDRYYVPGTVSYHPTMAYPYYGGYYGYWGATYTTVYSPGYYEESVNVFLESNIYSLDNDILVWSAQSQTEDPSSVQALAENYARVLVDEIIKNKVISPAAEG
jgi:hypothetical protein